MYVCFDACHFKEIQKFSVMTLNRRMFRFKSVCRKLVELFIIREAQRSNNIERRMMAVLILLYVKQDSKGIQKNGGRKQR
jgi:hypothetical protein